MIFQESNIKMNSMYLVLLVLGLSKCGDSQFFGGGFGGFGCGQRNPTIGNQCHMIKQDNTVFCKGNVVLRKLTPIHKHI